MNVARILYPVEVLGPGKRIGIWVCGCSHGCPGCSNPELWNPRSEYEVSIDEIMQLVNRVSSNHQVDGFTISGGEPFDQPGELLKLIKSIKNISDDILVYTGYKLEELQDRGEKQTTAVLSIISVLIDGAYIEEKNDDSFLRGSSNQRIHFLSEDYKKEHEEYFMIGHNQIQNFTTADGVVSVGIHRRGFT